jgi:hypothetical protein
VRDLAGGGDLIFDFVHEDFRPYPSHLRKAQLGLRSETYRASARFCAEQFDFFNFYNPHAALCARPAVGHDVRYRRALIASHAGNALEAVAHAQTKRACRRGAKEGRSA